MRKITHRHPLQALFVETLKLLATYFFAFIAVFFKFITGSYFRSFGILFAKVQYGEMIADMRGKINGTVHSRNRAGAYMRNKVTPVNPQTTYQSAVRNRLTGNAQAWRGLLQAQRNAWNAAVSNWQRTNIFGQLRTPSGIALYNRLNNNLANISIATIADPPMPESIQALESLAVAADDSANTVTLTYSPAIDANTSMIVEATEPLSAGISFAKNSFRQIAVLVTADVSPFALAPAYAAKFGSTPVTGTKIFVRATMINQTSGGAGIPLVAFTITVA